MSFFLQRPLIKMPPQLLCPSRLYHTQWSPDQLQQVQSFLFQKLSFSTCLGFPLLSQTPRHADFEPILQQMRNKLANWKTKHLTLAGCTTLAKLVLNVIPTHIMQCNILPIRTTQNINKLIKNFIWGSTTEKRKIHSVNWATITKFKN